MATIRDSAATEAPPPHPVAGRDPDRGPPRSSGTLATPRACLPACGRFFDLRNFEIYRNTSGVPQTKKARKSGENAEQQDALRRFKAEVFQVLGHPTRIHIVECLRDGELAVNAILERVGVEPANLSQHLGVLRGKNLLVKRKDGNQVLYSLRDPLLVEVLMIMRRYFQAHLEESMSMLKQIARER